jgi:hypothetical protein
LGWLLYKNITTNNITSSLDGKPSRAEPLLEFSNLKLQNFLM